MTGYGGYSRLPGQSVFFRMISMSTGKPPCAFPEYHPHAAENIFIEIDYFFDTFSIKTGVFCNTHNAAF